MSPSSQTAADLYRTATDEVRTIIFLDVDGVLNVGARDEGGYPLLLNKENITRARSILTSGVSSECARKLRALARHPMGKEGGTFEELVADGSTQLSSVCLDRLADIICACDSQPMIVLSSAWRREKHRHRREALQKELAHRLGRFYFDFDDITPQCEDTTGALRLQCIGEYLASLKMPSFSEVRLLILDDFFISSPHELRVGGAHLHSVADIEKYLLSRCEGGGDVKLKVVHPYMEFSTGNNLQVEVATGLTQEHHTAAMDFVMGGRGGSTRRGKRALTPGLPSLRIKAPAVGTLFTRLRSNDSSDVPIVKKISSTRSCSSRRSSSKSSHAGTQPRGLLMRMAGVMSMTSSA